jgi:allantoin racemase
LRIWHQSYSDLRELPGYVSWLTQHSAQVLPGATVDFHGLRALDDGPMEVEDKNSALVSAAITAQDQGYDAFVLGCIYDPALEACRAAVTIPVLALAESVARLSELVSGPLGLLVLAEEEITVVGKLMTTYGLRSHEARVVALMPEHSEEQLDQAGREQQWTPVAAADEIASQLRVHGVTTVLAAEGVLNEYIWAANTSGGHDTHVGDSIGWLWRETRAAIEHRPALATAATSSSLAAAPANSRVEWFRATRTSEATTTLRQAVLGPGRTKENS